MRVPRFTIFDIIWLTLLIAFVFINWRPFWIPMTILICLGMAAASVS